MLMISSQGVECAVPSPQLDCPELDDSNDSTNLPASHESVDEL